MPTDPATAPETAAPAQPASDMAALIAAEVGKQVNGRLRTLPELVAKAVADSVPAIVEQIGKAPKPADPAAQPSGNDAEKDQKLTLKALHDQIAGLTKAIEAEKKRTAEAEAAARGARLDSEVRAAFQKQLGDGPFVAPLVAQHHGVGKAFDLDADGKVVAKVKRDGYEESVPIADWFKERAEEFKPFLPTANRGLPPSSVPGRGQPYRPQNQTAAPGMPFWMNDVITEVGKDRPELAAAIAAQAPNGTVK